MQDTMAECIKGSPKSKRTKIKQLPLSVASGGWWVTLTLDHWNEHERRDVKSRSAPCWTGSQWQQWQKGCTAHGKKTVGRLQQNTWWDTWWDIAEVQDSLGRLCSLRRAPPPVFVSAQRLHSERLGGTAVFPGTWAGLIGIAEYPDHGRTTQSASHTHTCTLTYNT